MSSKSSNPTAAEKRMDLASFFCMVARHGPAVALAVVAAVFVLVGVLIYRGMGRKRRKADAAASGAKGVRTKVEATAVVNDRWSEEGQKPSESTDLSDNSSDLKVHIRHRHSLAEKKSTNILPHSDSSPDDTSPVWDCGAEEHVVRATKKLRDDFQTENFTDVVEKSVFSQRLQGQKDLEEKKCLMSTLFEGGSPKNKPQVLQKVFHEDKKVPFADVPNVTNHQEGVKQSSQSPLPNDKCEDYQKMSDVFPIHQDYSEEHSIHSEDVSMSLCHGKVAKFEDTCPINAGQEVVPVCRVNSPKVEPLPQAPCTFRQHSQKELEKIIASDFSSEHKITPEVTEKVVDDNLNKLINDTQLQLLKIDGQSENLEDSEKTQSCLRKKKSGQCIEAIASNSHELNATIEQELSVSQSDECTLPTKENMDEVGTKISALTNTPAEQSIISDYPNVSTDNLCSGIKANENAGDKVHTTEGNEVHNGANFSLVALETEHNMAESHSEETPLLVVKESDLVSSLGCEAEIRNSTIDVSLDLQDTDVLKMSPETRQVKNTPDLQQSVFSLEKSTSIYSGEQNQTTKGIEEVVIADHFDKKIGVAETLQNPKQEFEIVEISDNIGQSTKSQKCDLTTEVMREVGVESDAQLSQVDGKGQEECVKCSENVTVSALDGPQTNEVIEHSEELVQMDCHNKEVDEHQLEVVAETISILDDHVTDQTGEINRDITAKKYVKNSQCSDFKTHAQQNEQEGNTLPMDDVAESAVPPEAVYCQRGQVEIADITPVFVAEKDVESKILELCPPLQSEEMHFAREAFFPANEDMCGDDIENNYFGAFDQETGMIGDGFTNTTNEMDNMLDPTSSIELVELKKEVGETEMIQDFAKTEISIMEATMDNNEWVTEGSDQFLPSRKLPDTVYNPEFIKPSSLSNEHHHSRNSVLCSDMGTTSTGNLKTVGHPDLEKTIKTVKKIVAIQPMAQNVRVTFHIHYLTQSPFQKVAITGSHPELGNWKEFLSLESDKDGNWSTVVTLPVESHMEWKFVVVDQGDVCRWEECGNRLLDTGFGEDLIVHEWWGFL